MEIKVSDRRGQYLDQLGLDSVYSIVNYLPKKYIDLSVDHIDITKHNKKITLLVKIASEVIFKRIKSHLSKIEFEGIIDGEYYTITIFNREYLKNLLVENRIIKIIGKVDYYKKNITLSDIFFDYHSLIDYHYRLPNGFKDKEFNAIVKDSFAYLDFNRIELDELPKYFIDKYRLLSKKDSLRMLHFPNNIDDIRKGFRHLKYEEFLEFVLVMELAKRKFKEGHNMVYKHVDIDRVKKFISSLPYTPTSSQFLAFREILADIEGELNMYR